MTAAIGFLAASVESAEWSDEAWDSGRNPELCLYRDRTTAILRKFFRMSVETGRLPSILGPGIFPHACDVVQHLELRGCGDLRA